MKIVTYQYNDRFIRHKRLGIYEEKESRIIDPNLVIAAKLESEGKFNFYEKADFIIPSKLSDLLKLSVNPLETLNKSYDDFLSLQKKGLNELRDGTAISFSFGKNENISLSAPLDKVTTYRDFYAHEKHVAAGFKKRNEKIPSEWYEIPAYYKGATTGFLGPDDEILWPSYTNILDYELELGMVIGREGINIKEQDAIKHIFGFTILNDISARDIQRKEMAVRLGPAKGKDFCSIMGPVITTIDEFDNKIPDLLMTAKVNGEEWSRGQSGDSHFSWEEMIAHVSMDEWVLSGDLFGSGTVGTGCGLELDKWIKEGDSLELYVEGIGTLKNKVGNKRVK